MSIRLGSLTLKHGIMLAPMAGYTDRAFRVVANECGAELSVTEMISAKACVFGDKKTLKLAAIKEDEGSVALQIFGSEPDTMARAAEILSRPVEKGCVAPVAIDVNMGCPVHKIFSNGDGSALMRDPELIFDIIRAIRGATELPVTAKMRLGIDREHMNATECALACEAAGAAMITLHGRTRAELYMGEADREEIARVKKHLRIPLVANGDITSAASAIDMLDITGADGIAVGRGAVGNPFIFREIIDALEGRLSKHPSLSELSEVALRQLKLAIEDKGETSAVLEARKQIALYLRSFPGAAALRRDINSATTYDEVARVLESRAILSGE